MMASGQAVHHGLYKVQGGLLGLEVQQGGAEAADVKGGLMCAAAAMLLCHQMTCSSKATSGSLVRVKHTHLELKANT
jgi:hypothetical protein